MWWRGVFVGGQLHPYRKEAGPTETQFWWYFPLMHTPFDAELPNLTWQQIWEGSCF